MKDLTSVTERLAIEELLMGKDMATPTYWETYETLMALNDSNEDGEN